MFRTVFIVSVLSLAAVDCGKLVPPMNASIKGEKTTFPNQVEIRCDEGFILRGTNRRKCEADRTWSGGSTFCEGNTHWSESLDYFLWGKGTGGLMGLSFLRFKLLIFKPVASVFFLGSSFFYGGLG